MCVRLAPKLCTSFHTGTQTSTEPIKESTVAVVMLAEEGRLEIYEDPIKVQDTPSNPLKVKTDN